MNKQLIEAYKMQKRLEKEINKVIPEIYACFALVLYRQGWEPDAIEELFAETQIEWNNNVDSMEDMIQHVSEVTGIEVRGDNYDQS